MAAPMIRKASHEGVDYSVVELGGLQRVSAVAVPRRGTTLRQQVANALRALQEIMSDERVQGSVVQQAVFAAEGNLDDCRQIVHEHCGRELPATSYIAQPPCGGVSLAIEAIAVGPHGNVEIDRVSEQLVIVRYDGIAWAHCAPVVPQPSPSDVYECTTKALEQLRVLLGDVGVGFDNVLRTWFYVGGILDEQGDVSCYQEFNRARADFFRNISFIDSQKLKAGRGRDYPASTGIGAEGQGIALSAIAVASHLKEVVAVSLENPRQTSAYAYDSNHGSSNPRFSRAVALSCGTHATIFISGTASIIRSETHHLHDVIAQTHETLDNIASLISEENLQRHGLPGLGTPLQGLGLVHVYLKRSADYAAVRTVCQKRLGDLPVIYTVADVCRSDLLVEIEGIALAVQGAATDTTR